MRFFFICQLIITPINWQMKLFLTILFSLLLLNLSCSTFLLVAQTDKQNEVIDATQFHFTDTLLHIPTIEITAKKIRKHPIGSPSQTWEFAKRSANNVNNIAQLLQAESGVYIKNYGSGTVATSAIRGGSAGHTLVLWNDLPLQSPMLGLLDLSLLPIITAETITLQKGGSTALWGSGAIGGTIALNNQANFTNRFSISKQTTIGSFGQWQQQVKLGLGNSKIQSVSKFFYQQATNDFYYPIAPNLPKQQQTNARLKQYHFLQDVYWQINKKQQLAFHFWRQFSDREIPPLITQTKSIAYQKDAANRFLIDWQHQQKRQLLQAKLGYFEEDLGYYDELTLLKPALSYFKTWTADAGAQWNWQKKMRHQFYLGTTYAFTKAIAPNYAHTPKQHKIALLSTYQINTKKIKVQASVRQEMLNGKSVPLVPILAMNFLPIKQLRLQAKISRNYRLPTLNDLHWQPGGNPNLLAETGWSEELTAATYLSKKQQQFKLSITAFNRNINNWIMWSRLEGDSFWSANNITKVWSRGLENRLVYTYQRKQFKTKINIGYDFIRSTNQVAINSPSIDAGEQLYYTPIHQAYASASVDWRSWQLIYQHTFTSATKGINDRIANCQIANTRLQYQTNWKQFNGALFFNINNLFNTNYMVVERRAMPGINYQIGLNLLFEKTN